MSKAFPSALDTHLQGEVLSVSTCVRITKSDGTELRMTDHDRPLTVGGDTFLPNVSFEMSAIKSSSDLSTDNAEITIGLDGSTLSRKHFESDLFRRAPIEVLIVNWENTAQGAGYLKRGNVGDITILDQSRVRVQIRGLTQALQRTFVELYSPTCRVAFGGEKCGFANIPNKLRKDGGEYRTADWFFVPFSATAVALTNASFEANGLVANSSSGISGWTYGAGSFWKTSNAFAGVDGSYYLEGGDDGQGAATGQPVLFTQSLTTSAMGMSNTNVDTGDYAMSVEINIANTGLDLKNKGRVTLTLYDVNNNALRVERTPLAAYKYQEWTALRLPAFLVPGTRRIEVRLEAYKFSGTFATIAFDNARVSWWNNAAAAFNDKLFKVCRFPAYGASERVPLTNTSFENNGIVANSNSGISDWTYGGYWYTAAAVGALAPVGGGFLLHAGDSTSGVQETYTLSQTKTIKIDTYVEGGTDPYISTADIDAGRALVQMFVPVARTDADSTYALTLDFLSATDTLISSATTGYLSPATINVWTVANIFAAAPAGTRKVRYKLEGRTPAGTSVGGIAFDTVSAYLMNASIEAVEDAETSTLAASIPAALAALPIGSYAFDGNAIVQARAHVFGVSTISTLVSQKEFEATTISMTAEQAYSGRIVWLSGANAGRVSFIRSWNDTSKRMVLYEPLADTPVLGDKFIFAQGCSKTITDCATRFDNATNFRGEPYLPGTAKVIEFFTVTSADA
jgi:hypothetical protein